MTTLHAETAEIMAEARARGIDAGWSAANYEAAYGNDWSAVNFALDGSQLADQRYSADTAEWWAYFSGYAEGVERYQADQWQDGTPRHEPDDN